MPYIHATSIVKETLAQRQMQQLLRNTTAEGRWGLVYYRYFFLNIHHCYLGYLYLKPHLYIKNV